MRGGPAFAVSLVLSALEPALRAAAELGAWQIISPVNALGRVVVVGGLHEVQDEVRARSPLTQDRAILFQSGLCTRPANPSKSQGLCDLVPEGSTFFSKNGLKATRSQAGQEPPARDAVNARGCKLSMD